jgi:hypothetical protein
LKGGKQLLAFRITQVRCNRELEINLQSAPSSRAFTFARSPFDLVHITFLLSGVPSPRRYNVLVGVPQRQNDSSGKHRRSIYATETAGLLLIALLLLVLTLVRYWHDFHWSWR